MIKIYKYIYVEAKAAGTFRSSEHRELIDKYSEEGWRFITAIPTVFSGYGLIRQFDLIFEKEI
ncbi:uncharacterized protein DUF4177 [Desulfitobacterium sp. LBE]|uniref:DUF4177 domain-containing protein n=1 Tax=Desulfitobacterium sp. LBE TaxID=884086 RepID=UPI00119A491F|nr:DUF4177 domain-containing protein [Desulfitobacterium sp. LBE]TWH58117.1 uncharacterized protein DUF4177 [Desulfitobacterium sp. LBE]